MPHTPLRTAFNRPWPGTRRGFCLALFSVAFMYLGAVNYILTDPPSITREALSFPFDIAPPPVWGYLIMTISALALWSSYCHFGRDKYGFTLLAVFCGGWGASYWCGYFFYDASLRATSGSVTWWVFAAILMVIAGFPNVALRQPPRVIDDGPRHPHKEA